MRDVTTSTVIKLKLLYTVSQLMNMEKANMPVGVVIRPALPVTDKDPTPLPQ